MRETLDFIQLPLDAAEDFESAEAFDKQTDRIFPVGGTSQVIVRQSGDPDVTLEVEITRDGDNLVVTTRNLEQLSAESLRFLRTFSPRMQLSEWGRVFASLPPGLVQGRIVVQWSKLNVPEQGLYRALSPEGLDAVIEAIADQWEIAAEPRVLIIETLNSAIARGDGCIVRPLGGDTPPSQGPLVVPIDVPEALAGGFARLQLTYTFRIALKIPVPSDLVCSLVDAINFARWVQPESIRAVIIAAYLSDDRYNVGSTQLTDLLSHLQAVEREMASAAVERLDRAAEAFKSISLNTLRDAARLQEGLTTLAGQEAFRVASAIAITLAGLKLTAIVPGDLSYALAGALGLLFFAGAVIRVRTLDGEFRRLSEFHQLVDTGVLSVAAPKIAAWHVRTRISSVKRFYSTARVALIIAGAPLIALAILWSFSSGGLAGSMARALWIFLMVVPVAIFWLSWRPERLSETVEKSA